ncbi:MAG: CHAT domain-containing protein [Cytophagales bacterium]|nr:CHAT domain-containing protein [Bernardetiaceae bacterium]MDW8209757.1 CHAT domain-containing protein [Cytophagales bacterium]
MTTTSSDQAKALENPYLHCGLYLAGAKHTPPDQGKQMNGYDDGILTAYEAVSLDLKETELVVLSARATGVGNKAE